MTTPSSTSSPYQRFATHSWKSVEFLVNQQKEDGSYSGAENDISCYYKHPFFLALSGKTLEAHKILDYLKATMFQSNGDFISQPKGGVKSLNPDLAHYHCYTNGWLVLAAQILGRFEISYLGYSFIKKFFNTKINAFTTNKPSGESDTDTFDLITNAHLGTIALCMGDLPTAEHIGAWLATIAKQNTDPSLFYIRQDIHGNLAKNYDSKLDQKAARSCYLVARDQEFQLYFMMGYPVAFLAKLYLATGKQQYLDLAKHYQQFVLDSHESSRRSHWAHKAGWGASELARITGEKQYVDYASKIASHLSDTQTGDGAFKREDGKLQEYDQTAEAGVWLRVIHANLTTTHQK